MAAIKLMIDLNGQPVYYTLVTTDRPNQEGYFGAKLFDSELNFVNFSTSQMREECLKQVQDHLISRSMGKVLDIQGYNIPLDVEEMFLKRKYAG